MSFSNDVRNELARIVPEKVCCRKAELCAIFILRSEVTRRDGEGSFLITELENARPARKVYRLLKDAYGLSSTVRVETRKRFNKLRLYVVETPLSQPESDELLRDLGTTSKGIRRQVNWPLVSRYCCKRAFLRGIFISRGFINRPEGDYHLEIVLNDSRLVNEVVKIMHRLDIEVRIGERKNNLLIYIKESEKIVDFLRIVEASNALLEFENVRIVKSMRNQVNRQVNCETANLAKTVEASVRQVTIIKKLLAREGISGIPANLRELAMLRLDHPDSTFRELGAMLDPPLTKSGVAYRMQKLEDFAEAVFDE